MRREKDWERCFPVVAEKSRDNVCDETWGDLVPFGEGLFDHRDQLRGITWGLCCARVLEIEETRKIVPEVGGFPPVETIETVFGRLLWDTTHDRSTRHHRPWVLNDKEQIGVLLLEISYNIDRLFQYLVPKPCILTERLERIPVPRQVRTREYRE